jgi:hypothetical protein
MKATMPTQPVHDIVIHARENHLIVGTHGRGIFITDITPLQEVGPNGLAADFHLFTVEPKVKWVARRDRVAANTNIDAPSEPNGIVVNYFQKAPSAGDVTVQVLQGSRVVAEGKGPNTAGLNRVLWNMRTTPVLAPGAKPEPVRGMGGFQRGGQPVSSIASFGGSIPADPGEYTVVVKAGGKTYTQTTRVLEDVWFDKVF